MANPPVSLLKVGSLGKPHGVQGWLKFHWYGSDTPHPRDHLLNAAGEPMPITALRLQGQQWLIKLVGVNSPEAALQYSGNAVFMRRQSLDADEWYHADLLDMTVISAENVLQGTVSAVHNFGAGDIVEITRPDGTKAMLPFTRDAVLQIDQQKRIVMIAMDWLV